MFPPTKTNQQRGRSAGMPHGRYKHTLRDGGLPVVRFGVWETKPTHDRCVRRYTDGVCDRKSTTTFAIEVDGTMGVRTNSVPAKPMRYTHPHDDLFFIHIAAWTRGLRGSGVNIRRDTCTAMFWGQEHNRPVGTIVGDRSGQSTSDSTQHDTVNNQSDASHSPV